MNKYCTMKDRHQAEIDAFPMFFAFSTEQFTEGMKKLELRPDETDKIRKVGTTGGFIRKTDDDAFCKMLERHEQERDDAIGSDETGEGFIFDMFSYELANHEYNYTYDTEDTLDALGITQQDLANNPALRLGLYNACAAQPACTLY